ncbi:chorismate mutase [Hortaea werneckii]|nr:chorismate mutase [Hortaea werneckii]KAI7304506.1 chorismate mutase [Hortaea werneckii]
MDTALETWDPATTLSLPHIRAQLIRLEDTVLFHLIERAQFPLNSTIYTNPSPLPLPNAGNLSFMDWVLRSQEELQAQIRRFQSPDQFPFFPDAVFHVPVVLPELQYPRVLWENTVNVNSDLKSRYVSSVLPAVCRPTDRAERVHDAQENYGSSATADIMCLQSLSQRIHFGKFVAESKFRQETQRFVDLIKREDREGIDQAITNAAVEKKVLERLRMKAEMYGADPNMDSEKEGTRKINVEAVVEMYQNLVIPLTKVVEVEYLMQRLKGTEWE